jgi:hypothetical protein
MSYLFQPLNTFQQKNSFDPLEFDSQNALNENLPKILENILNQILGGALFVDHNNFITNQFILAVETNPDKFVNKMGALSKYIQLLEIDVRKFILNYFV